MARDRIPTAPVADCLPVPVVECSLDRAAGRFRPGWWTFTGPGGGMFTGPGGGLFTGPGGGLFTGPGGGLFTGHGGGMFTGPGGGDYLQAPVEACLRDHVRIDTEAFGLQGRHY